MCGTVFICGVAAESPFTGYWLLVTAQMFDALWTCGAALAMANPQSCCRLA